MDHSIENQDTWKSEIDRGERFAFGRNWKNFSGTLNVEKLAASVTALQSFLGILNLQGKSFIDVGSGSGLSSGAAHELGATVTSFDYDEYSVACTQARMEFAKTDRWTVGRGSILDRPFVQSLGTYDVVYSWGVLHHTGQMEAALKNVSMLVKPGGLLWIAIYNDQGRKSRFWTEVKRRYVKGSRFMRAILLGLGFLRLWGPTLLRDLVALQPMRTWSSRQSDRGMSPWHDLVDWVGGYPFEVATPEAIFHFFRDRGYSLENLRTCGGGIGCNEFLFRLKAE